jgi:molybdopterin molybdotransferase
MLSVEAARAAMLARVGKLGGEIVALADLDGRTLAADLAATRDQPPFDAAVMDGYAFRSADAPGLLRIVGEAAAGHAFAPAIAKGEAVRISTGAPLPVGADVVLAQEEARIDNGQLEVAGAKAGGFVRRRGGDFAAGDILLRAGRLLDATAIMAIAGAGKAQAEVTRKPTICIHANGDELANPGEVPRSDQIFDSASYAVASLLRAWGAAAKGGAPLGDQPDAIAPTLKSSLQACDLVVIIGGASVGPHDHLRPIIRELGGELLVEGISVRPGRPTWFAQMPGDKLAFGLPGNPASALVCARLFLAPLIETMLTGAHAQADLTFDRRLSGPMPANGSREAYVRAIASQVEVSPILDEDSSMMGVLARSNCLVRRGAQSPALTTGASVACLAWSPVPA